MAQVASLGNCLNILGFKDIKSAFDLFNVASEEKSEYSENNCKREESSLEYKFIEELKSKDSKVYKERRNIRDGTDTWTYAAAEGDWELVHVCQMESSGEQ